MLNAHSFEHGGNHEQILYDHLLECVKSQSPEQVLERFDYLFIKARGYDNQEVLNALATVISSNDAEYKFQFVLNRSCHILINRWQLQPNTQKYIHQLVEMFDSLPPAWSSGYKKSFSTHLQQLVIKFVNSDYYKQLKRLRTIIDQGKNKKQELIGNLINRYPYLYSHCLLSADSSVEQQETIYNVKNKLQKNFEFKLSKYVTYQVRVAQASKTRKLIQKSPNIIKPVSNPTLLSQRDLGRSLKHYLGTAHNGYTYKDLSRSFITHTNDVRNYKSFKDDLYEYIVQSVDPKYGKHRFNKNLYATLTNTYPQYNYQKPDEFLKMRTYSQLFNYLIVKSPKNPEHLIFMDLVSNMGTTKTIGLFLQLTLLCHKVKPYLEKRFSILFNHYESSTRDSLRWLVKSLEKLNLAFFTNFGNSDLSFLGKIYTKS